MKIKKKELIIGIVAILLIVAIGITYGINKSGSKAVEPKKIEKTAKKENKKEKGTVSKADKSEDKKTDAKSEKKAEDKKKEDSGDKAAKSENNGTKTSSNSSSTHNASTPSHSSNSSGSGSTPAQKPKRWVVDQAAWDETVTKYRTETVTKYYCGGQYFDDYNSGYAYYMSELEKGNNVGSLSPVTQEIQVPYQEVIHHDEVGHWE